jgi:hypothetical protein
MVIHKIAGAHLRHTVTLNKPVHVIRLAVNNLLE